MEIIWVFNTTFLDDTQIEYTMEEQFDYDELVDVLIERVIAVNGYY